MQLKAIWLSFILIGLSTQLPQNPESVTAPPTRNDARNQTVSCKTSKGLKGMCIGRERCDYGTNNIDFTLYAPRAYKQPCALKEVCCPFQYTLVQEEPFEKEINIDFDE